jgi:uncharacterized protein (DUF2062 family)
MPTNDHEAKAGLEPGSLDSRESAPVASDRHERVRRFKRLLRFMPRRAVFHRYPLVGRLAPYARRRAYLWSFKPRNVRPALYLGAMLSLLPLIGIQLVIALAGAVLLRANVMIAGGLQFLTNPFTAAPIYYVTYRAGRKILSWFGQTPPGPVLEEIPEELVTGATIVETDFSSGFTGTVGALIVGGLACGLLLGLILDVLYLRSVRTARQTGTALQGV